MRLDEITENANTEERGRHKDRALRPCSGEVSTVRETL